MSPVKEICTAFDGLCPVCGGTGYEWVEVETADGSYKAVKKCSACNGNHDGKVKEALEQSDLQMPESYSDFDWSVYGADTLRERQRVSKFIECFPEFEAEGLGLFISSRTRGSGKTFLASAIGKELIIRYEASVLFVNASDLLDIDQRKTDDGQDPLERFINCRVLILDDLGQKMTGQNYLSDVLYKIINKRYSQKKLMIITSNVPLPELSFDDRIVDRLNSMTFTVALPEYCVRAREADGRKRRFLQKMGIQ